MVKIDAFYFLLIIEVGAAFLVWALYASSKARKYYQRLRVESEGKMEFKEPNREDLKIVSAPDPVSSEDKEPFLEKVRALEKEASKKNHSLEEARKKNETLEKQLTEMNNKLEAMKKQYSDLEKEYSVLYSHGRERKKEEG